MYVEANAVQLNCTDQFIVTLIIVSIDFDKVVLRLLQHKRSVTHDHKQKLIGERTGRHGKR